MAVYGGPDIVTDGLVLHLDAANDKSYDPVVEDCSLVLNMEGSNGSTTFTDGSKYGHSVTANGNAQISTENSRFGASSAYFDGNGDYLNISTPPESLVKWFDEDYTLEAWAYLAGNPTNGANGHSTMISNSYLNSNGEYWSFGPLNNRTVRFYYWNGAQNSVTTSTSLNLFQWYHLVFVKNGSNIKIYIDGVESASQTISGTPTSGSDGPFTIGRATNTGAFNGYIDSLRIVKGKALYTENFTPPKKSFPEYKWGDLSGNDNHFSLVNGVSYNNNGYFTTDGVNDYIVSSSPVNLSSYTYIVAEIWIKSLDDGAFQQAFEHSNNWNTNAGAFGLFIHNNGYGHVKNEHHTNHLGQLTRNYVFQADENWVRHVNLYSAIPDSTGRKIWTNGETSVFGTISGQNAFVGSEATSQNVAFRNDYFYIGARGGVSAFSQAAYSSFKLYGFKVLDSEVLQNFNALKGRYGL